MKKSPGKWIKTVLFGKKISKSSLSKNAKPDKKPDVKLTVVDPAGDSEPSHSTDRGVENIEIEKSLPDVSLCVTNTSDPQNKIVSVQLSDDEMQRQDEAATKTQAAFRGYLARRAFRALRGIIRLQALIRGHLVRRQAIATLRCMQAIVKLQALARVRKDAKLDIGSNSFFPLATNPFIRKLLVSLPTAMPLSLQYEPAEPNSSGNWLERWSLSHFWELSTKTKKILNSNPQKKHSNAQNPEPDSGKSKRTTRKVSTVINGDSSALSSLEMEKPKRNPKKIIHHQIESVQEYPQNELERVKRNLKKVSASAAAAYEKSETETEKIVPISDKEILIISEKLSDSDIAVEKLVLVEASSEKIKIVEPVHVPDNDTPVVETNCSENGEKMENSPNIQEDLGSKEEESGKENQKIRKRRSLPAKPEYTENISHNNPSRPSYMAATESAKAKLRAQGSAKINEDGDEYGNVRRHSLPASTNGKMSSMSPRIQKPVQANGKGGGKTNNILTASRDDKVILPGWRR